MKLATLNDGSRDGQLIVVSRDLKTAAIATEIAPTMQNLLDSWEFMAPQCEDLYVQLNHGRAAYSFDFDPQQCMAPLPRAFQFVTTCAYVGYAELIHRSHGRDIPEIMRTEPVLQQAASYNFSGPRTPIVLADEASGCDLETQIALILGDVRIGTKPATISEQIRLVMLVSDISLRELIPLEMSSSVGFLNSKPLSSFAPVAVTPDEFGEEWNSGGVYLPLRTSLNGKLIGQPNAGVDMTFSFPELIAQLAKTRDIKAGTLIGSGCVYNKEGTKGHSSLYGIRAQEIITQGAATTAYLHFGDTIKVDMLDKHGKSIMGAIEQQVVAASSVSK